MILQKTSYLQVFLRSMSLPSSPCPLTPRDLKEKLCSAEARRVELNKLRKINIDERLASVQTKGSFKCTFFGKVL